MTVLLFIVAWQWKNFLNTLGKAYQTWRGWIRAFKTHLWYAKMIEKTKKDVPANGGISPIQPLVRVKNIQSGVLSKEKKRWIRQRLEHLLQNIGKRKKLTQAQLAEKLNITDKDENLIASGISFLLAIPFLFITNIMLSKMTAEPVLIIKKYSLSWSR